MHLKQKNKKKTARPTPRCRQTHGLFWSGRVNVAADQGRGDNNSQELSWTLSAAGNSLAAAPEPTRCLQSGSQEFSAGGEWEELSSVPAVAPCRRRHSVPISLKHEEPHSVGQDLLILVPPASPRRPHGLFWIEFSRILYCHYTVDKILQVPSFSA